MYNNEKTVTIQKDTAIAFVTKSGTVMGNHRVRRLDDGRVVIAYNLLPAVAGSLSKKTHSEKDNDPRAYYVLDQDASYPRICRADTCDAPCSYQGSTGKKVLAFAGDASGVEVTVSNNGDVDLEFTPKAADQNADGTTFVVDWNKAALKSVQKVQLVTLR